MYPYPSRSSNQLEESTKERLDRKERRLENINKSFRDKPMEFWKREPCTVEMEHTTYYSITPSLSHFSRMSATLERASSAVTSYSSQSLSVRDSTVKSPCA